MQPCTRFANLEGQQNVEIRPKVKRIYSKVYVEGQVVKRATLFKLETQMLNQDASAKSNGFHSAVEVDRLNHVDRNIISNVQLATAKLAQAKCVWKYCC
jgi:membrane fusion protein (multidrug efflux system)